MVSFHHFSAAHLHALISLYNVNVASSLTKSQLGARLLTFPASSDPHCLLIFQSQSRPRTAKSLATLAGSLTLPMSSSERKRKSRAEESELDGLNRRTNDAASKRRKYNDDILKNFQVAAAIRASFPSLPPDDIRHSTIADFQRAIHPSNFVPHPCAVCQKICFGSDYRTVPHEDVDFSILCNPDIPDHLLPVTYDIEVYGRAILYAKGLHSLDQQGNVDMCLACHKSLVKSDPPQLPKFVLANYYYYARERLPLPVRDAFADASIYELNLVAACRASCITHRFTVDASHGLRFDPSTAQGFSRGNTIILPQDPSGLREVLPPSSEEIKASLCALFVSKTKPTLENIAALHPVMVSKTRVETLIHFLLEENPFYRAAGISFSQDNLDDLLEPRFSNADCGILRAANTGFTEISEAIRSGTSDYTDRYSDLNPTPTDVDASGSESYSQSELLMESVGYTDGDHTPQNYLVMKAKALAWCQSGKPFIKSQAASQPMMDRDEGFLTSVFPHLDPWGIGALNHPRCRTRTSFQRQVQHLLQIDDSPFERDPNFAYICWNILAKAEVNTTMRFRVKDNQRRNIIADLLSIPPAVFTELAKKLEIDPRTPASGVLERKAMRVMAKLRQVSSNLKGSTGSKQFMRNEIRGLMNVLGMPALFVTLNPADVHHPLVRMLAGNEIDPDAILKGDPLDKHTRACLVAKHPAATAQFFDIMISNFIMHVLCYNNGEGLLGKCTGYYGTVEAQGKGTLHLHMLIWINGNLNPQALHDRMEAEPEYKQKMFTWLETHISTSLPGQPLVVDDPSNRSRPYLNKDKPHPSSIYAPQIAGYADDESFQRDFRRFVSELVCACNWHNHTDTCWKNLRKDEPRDDKHCPMRIDGTTRPFTMLDEETGSILLRCLHPRINNFNDVIIFLLQCNMDIKYIGSGEAAKALTFYVTDYITKPCLPVHVGFAAIMYALEQNDLKFAGKEDTRDNAALRERSLLTKSVNAMMSKTELSHQQVMSYLVGGGDHYTGHTFRTLYWGSFDRWIRQKMPNENLPPIASEELATQHLDNTTVRSKSESELIAAANLILPSPSSPVLESKAELTV